ncbi:MAG TPA: circadian clock protein KaiC [Polyangia bacterium]|nr:circadian clock protein KaiC [Polyangia bacterium]
MLSPRNRRSVSRVLPSLAKTPTGIQGLDQVTGGGLPSGRAALVCGGPGSGKTLLGMEFLIRGAQRFGDPGLFVGFEETPKELALNVASLGFDVNRLVERKLLAIDQVQVDRSEIEETGEYNLEGLFVRLDAAIKAVGARRLVIDTLETLFTGFDNQAILRAELARLFRWLKNRGITSIITAERGEGALTRHGLEEYVSDCVITLDHRTSGESATRWLRVVKYRGSSHGTNDYPFLIDQGGVSVLPITAHGLDYPVSSQRVSTGVASLDEMMGGKGYFRGSSVLVSGAAGTGKTSLASAFANATCGAGRRCLYVAFEEAMSQVVRNMRSTGIDLGRWIDAGLLAFHAARPSVFGLEMHLIAIHRLIEQLAPDAVILDPISSLVGSAPVAEVKSLLVRLLDYLKTKQITGLFTSLATATSVEETEIGVSSLIDTWLQVRDVESRGERNRAIYVIKSRGMPHSNQVREFVITSSGIDLLPVQSGPDGVLIGSARLRRAAEEAGLILSRRQEAERRRRALRRRRAAVDSQIATLRAELAAEEEDLKAMMVDEQKLADRDQEDSATLERRRQGQDRTLRQPSLRAARRGRRS